MSQTIKGRVHEIGATQQVSDTFKKRDLILEYAENPTSPEFIKLEAMQDKCGLLDALKAGQEVEVSYNLRGKPWTDKTGKTSYFNTLSIWKINSIGSVTPIPTPQVNQAPVVEDDLPF